MTNTTKQKQNLFFQNPVMKKFSKIQEQSDEHVTYRGVAKKCCFFVLMIIAGIVLTFFTNFLCGITNTFNDKFPLPVIALAGVSTLTLLVTPFIAIFAKKTTPVTGSMFCISVGVVYSTLALFIDTYRNEILLAMLLTVALFTALVLLFSLNLIKVNQKFQSVSYILLATMLIAAILLSIALFIPTLNGAVTAIVSNPLCSILFSLIGLAVAAMFILVDLQNVTEAVENNLPKFYEWDAAFGVIFSVIWLFAEILQLITNIKDGI